MSETQMMKQYYEIKAKYPGTVLFFRLGDFYEMFDEDAVEVSGILNITLTHRGESPMCGIPYHASSAYIKRLLNAGKKIAICEQIKLSEKTGKLAQREVVRVITPATVFEEDLLSETDYNFILSIYKKSCAYADISAGLFRMRDLNEKDFKESLKSIINELSPTEILVNDDEYFDISSENVLRDIADSCSAMVTKLPVWYFNVENNYKLLCENAGVKSLSSYGIQPKSSVLAPSGALLKYASETSSTKLNYISDYVLENDENYVRMDESTRKNLEIFNNLFDGSVKNSLFETINRCKTGSGTRLLKTYLSLPLRDIKTIKERQERIKFFISNPQELNRIKKLIQESSDLSRLTTRVLTKRAVPHDLILIKQSVQTFFKIISEHADFYSFILPDIFENNFNLSVVSDLANEIEKAINDNFLGQFNAGHVINLGYDSELDRLREMSQNGVSVLDDYLEYERKETSITNLKIDRNNVIGYFFEVPKGQLNKVPPYFIRKQTLTTGERFITDKLISLSSEVSASSLDADLREKQLYDLLVEKISDKTDILAKIGEFFSILDVYQGLSSLAIDSSFVCPEINLVDELEIKDGRHPVVEKQIGIGEFTANNLDMSTRFCLITGPNMAGKSTYLRQNAIIILLAHIGSYVPASYARIPLVDRIFCRVGAMDNLARGESTFLVEMQETAFILRNSTQKSFVIVDEIGRGTGTSDGISIAYAVMRALVDRNCMTLFATHFHELTSCDLTGIRLLTLEVSDENGTIIFLRKVKDGAVNTSYALHVAKLAGIPNNVIREARKFQNNHFDDYSISQPNLFASQNDYSMSEEVLSFVEELSEIDVNKLTPIDSLNILSDVVAKAKKYKF